MKLLVCGGRDFSNAARVDHILFAVHAKRPITQIIEGGASGADKLARQWAERAGIECRTFAAAWNQAGRRAGPIRNQLMLDDGQPDGVVAFPGGRGTADMVSRAKAAGIKVMEVTP